MNDNVVRYPELSNTERLPVVVSVSKSICFKFLENSIILGSHFSVTQAGLGLSIFISH